MGLENRKGRLYYYRKERDGARVRSVYCCGGSAALAMVRLAAEDAAEAAEAREARRLARAADEAAEAEIAAVARVCETLMTAALLASGFHTHKRQWRRRRDG